MYRANSAISTLCVWQKKKNFLKKGKERKMLPKLLENIMKKCNSLGQRKQFKILDGRINIQ